MPARFPNFRVHATARTIILVVGILITAMWAAVGVSIVTARQHALGRAGSEGQNLMLAFRAEVAYILRAVEGEMNLIAARMRREGGEFDLYAWGQENVLVSPGMAEATIILPDGKIGSMTLEADPRATNLGDREHFRVHLDGKFQGLFVGKTVIGRTSKAPILPLSRRVDAADGTFLGVLVVLISPTALTRLHQSIDLGPRGVLTLSGLDQVIRARFAADSPSGTVGIGTSLAGGPRTAVIAANFQGSFVRNSVMDGRSRLYTYGRVGDYPLVVSVGLDLEQELADWRSHAVIIAIVALCASLLLAGLAVYLICEIQVRTKKEAELAEERSKLRKTNVALTESTKSANAANLAKSRFLANMSHELRTPLNAIIGFSEMLTAGIPGRLGAQQQGYVENIHEAGSILLRVINDVLDLAQVDAGKFKLHEVEGVDLGRMADICTVLVREQANVGHLRLSLEIEDRTLLVVADPTRLKQILLNLLSNAIKFTDPGGSVTLAIYRSKNGGVVIEVRDTGGGMSDTEIEVALQPFGQVETGFARRHNGTGLGLPLVRTMAELHGGSLHIHSEKGRGTIVTVVLPLARVLADRAISVECKQVA